MKSLYHAEQLGLDLISPKCVGVRHVPGLYQSYLHSGCCKLIVFTLLQLHNICVYIYIYIRISNYILIRRLVAIVCAIYFENGCSKSLGFPSIKINGF